MIFKTSLFVIILLSFSLVAQSSNGELNGRVVSKIIVNGNRVTEREVIVREMLLSEGDVFNDSLRSVSEKRVHGTFLFNNVDIIPVPDLDDVALLVNVTERLFLYPLPVLQLEDRDWDKVTYGGGFAHINVGGRAEKLVGVALFGYKPGFNFEYENPWIGSRNNRYTLRLTAGRYESAHKTLRFDEKHITSEVQIGKYWTRHFSSSINLDYDRVDVPDSVSALMPAGKSRQEHFGLSLLTSYDNRDFSIYATRGWSLANLLSMEGLFSRDVRYLQVVNEVRHYKPWGPVTFAGRLHHVQTFGDLPLYRTVYFGFDERVRGHFSRVVAGKNRLLGSLEMRFPLMDDRLFNLPSYFLPASSTQNLKFGINGAFFIDSGVVWSDKNELALQNAISGFGFGLHFRIPYIEIARLELGFDREFNSEIIFEVGTAL